MDPEERATIRHPALVTLAFQLVRSNAATFSHMAPWVKALQTFRSVRTHLSNTRQLSEGSVTSRFALGGWTRPEPSHRKIIVGMAELSGLHRRHAVR